MNSFLVKITLSASILCLINLLIELLNYSFYRIISFRLLNYNVTYQISLSFIKYFNYLVFYEGWGKSEYDRLKIRDNRSN